MSFEHETAANTLGVTLNLSSMPYKGRIDVRAGTYEEITPRWRQGPGRWAQIASPRSAPGESVAAVADLVLAPWELRDFRRAKP